MQEIVNEIMRKRIEALEEVLKVLIPGMTLCVHSGDLERTDDNTFRIMESWHIVLVSEDCNYQGRKTQYSKPE